jgi:xylan 1,4-beta-xylosidase
MTPFHGGFGMLNYQCIEKPAFRAYQFLNMLGATRLTCKDQRSLAAKDESGCIQALFWDVTNNQPADVNNQDYYRTDIKAHLKSNILLQLTNLDPGQYRVSVYRIGYRLNDPFSDYFDHGCPNQLTRGQVAEIRKRNDGEPVLTEIVEVQRGEPIERSFDLRDNDVYLVCAGRI